MTVETALYPPQLNTSLPQASDMVSEGDDHIRLTKTVIKTTFPNVAGAVSASHTEINSLSGVAGNVQAQFNLKGTIAGQAWSGTHDFRSAALLAATAPAGSSNDIVATTAFVAAAGLAGTLPGQTGQAGNYIKSNGTTAFWAPAVASLNGETGNLVKNTLAGYGITNFKIEISGNSDLNTLVTAGQYRFTGSVPNAPPGITDSIVFVSMGGGIGSQTGSQTVVDYFSGILFTRGFYFLGDGSVVWSAWRRFAMRNEPAVAVSGSVVDLNKGGYFIDSVSANKTYTFANRVSGSSFFLEITHTGGAISFGGVYFPGGPAPSIPTGYRHLFYFQLPSFENAWLGCYYGNYPL